MGDVADDMVKGACCSRCMTYFERPHDYPVYCKKCWSETPPRDRKGYSVAIIPELAEQEGPDDETWLGDEDDEGDSEDNDDE